MLDSDVIKHIMSFLISNVYDFNNVRLTNKMYFRCSKELWDRPHVELTPLRTFVNVKICSVCTEIADCNTRSVPFGGFPKMVYVHCNKFDCTRSVIKSLLNFAYQSNILILAKEAVKDYRGEVPRSDGTSTLCYYDEGYLWKPNNMIRCMFGDYVKDVPIDKINPNYRQNYTIVKTL